MLENFGMHEQAKARRKLTEEVNEQLSEGLDNQLKKALAGSKMFRGKAADVAEEVKGKDLSLSSIAEAFNKKNAASKPQLPQFKATKQTRAILQEWALRQRGTDNKDTQ